MPSNSSAPQDGVVTGSEKAKSDKGTPKAPPTKKDKQVAVEAATKASSARMAESEGPWGRSREPEARKNWDEMTPVEQDAARRRWLFSTGDFGTPAGRFPPKSLPATKDKKAAGDAAQKGPSPKENIPGQ